jgi:hypothetical protein
MKAVRPVIEAWRKLSKDSSPDALMFPTFGRALSSSATFCGLHVKLREAAKARHDFLPDR